MNKSIFKSVFLLVVILTTLFFTVKQTRSADAQVPVMNTYNYTVVLKKNYFYIEMINTFPLDKGKRNLSIWLGKNQKGTVLVKNKTFNANKKKTVCVYYAKNKCKNQKRWYAKVKVKATKKQKSVWAKSYATNAMVISKEVKEPKTEDEEVPSIGYEEEDYETCTPSASSEC